MNKAPGVRGQPVLVMAVILGSWLAVRALLWEMPIEAQARSQGTGIQKVAARRLPARLAMLDTGVDGASPVSASLRGRRIARSAAASAGFDREPLALGQRAARQRSTPDTSVLAPVGVIAEFPAFGMMPERHGDVGHALEPTESNLPAPMRTAADRPLLGFGETRGEAADGRWSGDAWLLWREGSRAAVAPGITAYGRSQAGAVLRLRMARDSRRRPMAYVRATSALDSPRQGELAAGLSMRPVSRFPVRVAAESRITETDSGREVRPAAFAVTEFPPVRLPLGLQGEAYLQGGYVGGRYRTAFIDGHARINRRLIGSEQGADLHVGLAAWGGAQQDASRLDIGPSATGGMQIGGVSARLAADYRIRVAGDAAPRTGPALTLSAGF